MTEIIWQGSEQLRGLLVPIDDIFEHPENPRRGDVEAIAKSLQAFGQTKSVAVWAGEQPWVLAGNHTRRAAQHLGWTHIAASFVELTETEALAYLMADNRSSDFGDYDDSRRIEILDRLAERNVLDLALYERDDLKNLIETAKPPERPPFEEDDLDAVPPRLDQRSGDGVFTVEILLPEEEREQFARWVRMLRREWEADGTTVVVVRAVREAAERL